MKEPIVVAAEKNVILPYKPTKEYVVESLGDLPQKPMYDFAKRCFDIVFSSVLLLLLIVPMCIVGIIVRISSAGPALYTQERLGKDGRKIKIRKFRTMTTDSETDAIRWCSENDPRVTPLGRFLRRYHIDELPQLWDILRGALSFVGPRPEREAFYNAFEEYIHGFSERLKVKPGLTGMAQIAGDGLMPPEEKILYDVDYIKRRSLWLDIRVLFRTVLIVITGRYNPL